MICAGKFVDRWVKRIRSAVLTHRVCEGGRVDDRRKNWCVLTGVREIVDW